MINMQARRNLQAFCHEVDEGFKGGFFCRSIHCPKPVIPKLPIFEEMISQQIFKPVLANEGVSFKIEENVAVAGIGQTIQSKPCHRCQHLKPQFTAVSSFNLNSCLFPNANE